MSTYETSDFSLSVYLVCKGYDVVSAIAKNDRVHFTFANVSAEVVADFFTGKDSVSAMEMIRAEREVKQLIREKLPRTRMSRR